MNLIYCPNCECEMEIGSTCPECGTRDYSSSNEDKEVE